MNNTRYSGLVFSVGVNSYDNANPLAKACNDSDAFGNKMASLNFDVISVQDIDCTNFDIKKQEFLSRLAAEKHSVGIFYFAGHGVEFRGHNYLLVKDTKFDTNVPDVLKRSSIDLQALIDDISAVCDASVVIVDACRDNPFPQNLRGTYRTTLATMHAPKGTMIAFSTSPNDVASDGAPNDQNSPYTTALLHHLDEPGLEIERLFKKVRQTLDAVTQGGQTSWEHTSLIGNIVFNQAVANRATATNGAPYSPDALMDEKWIRQDNIESLIKGFKSLNFQTQAQALKDFLRSNTTYSPDQLFVIGRNILQAASAGEWESEAFVNDPSRIFKYNEKGGLNHLLNGMLYETYFNKFGDFRGTKPKFFDDWIGKAIASKNFTGSLDFIESQLLPYAGQLAFIPSNHAGLIDIAIVGDLSTTEFDTLLTIKELSINGKSYITDNPADQHPRSYLIEMHMNGDEFKTKLAEVLGLPLSLCRFVGNELIMTSTLFRFNDGYYLKAL